MVPCPNCGASVPGDVSVCPACQTSLEAVTTSGATRRCRNCGQNIDANEPACPACGQLKDPTICARHAERTAFGQCVVCAAAVCDECARQPETHYLCPRHHGVEVIAGWAEVYTTADDVEARLIRENLQAEGIDAEILSQKDRSFAVELGELAQVRLLVPAYSWAQAKNVLAEHMDVQGEVAFACPNCGEAYGPDDQVCAVCGRILPSTRA